MRCDSRSRRGRAGLVWLKASLSVGCAVVLGLSGACNAKAPGAVSAGDAGSATAPRASEFERVVEARVEPLLQFESRTVELKMDFGGNDSQVDRLVGRLAASARLDLPARDPAAPNVTLAEPEAGKAQGLRFQMTGAHVGTGAGQVEVSTGLENPKTLTVLWSWRVVGNLTVDPTNPFLDLRAQPSAGITIQVSSRRNDFRLSEAEVIEGPFEARVARSQGTSGGYAVQVRLRDGHQSEEARGWVGKLRLISNDPAEPQKDVPLFALGAP